MHGWNTFFDNFSHSTDGIRKGIIPSFWPAYPVWEPSVGTELPWGISQNTQVVSK